MHHTATVSAASAQYLRFAHRKHKASAKEEKRRHTRSRRSCCFGVFRHRVIPLKRVFSFDRTEKRLSAAERPRSGLLVAGRLWSFMRWNQGKPARESKEK